MDNDRIPDRALAPDATFDDLDPFFERLRRVWTDTSRRWLEYRRGGHGAPG